MNASNNTSRFDWRSAAWGASLETVFRQPAMAVSSVTIESRCGTVQAIRQLVAQGGLSKFYSGPGGFAMGLSTRAFHRVTTFYLNEEMQRRGHTLVTISACAAVFETVSAIGENYLSIMQTQKSSLSLWQVVKGRYQAYGMKAFTLGTGAGLGRNITFNMFYFGPSYFAPNWLEKYPVSSSVAAAASAVLSSHGWEMLRVRKSVNPDQNYRALLKEMWSELGPRMLSLGVLARLYSVGIGSMISMSVYQIAKQRNKD